MSRNGSGTMAIPNTLVSGEVIEASDHNENYSDIASEITNSVAVDGQSAMTGPLKAASGTVAAPGITFGSDTDSGLYRIGSNEIGVAVGGALVADVSSTGLAVTGTVSASGAVKQGGFSLLPVGAVFPYAGSAAPTGYLLCDGSSKLRASYPDLFTAIGTTYGSVDGTHFTLPDLTGRVVAGKESSATRLTNAVSGVDGGTLGSAGGTQSKTLVTGNLPAYTPAGSISGTVLSVFQNITSPAVGATHMALAAASGDGSTVDGSTLSATFTGTAQGGVSTPVAVVMPTIVLNYIIFAGV